MSNIISEEKEKTLNEWLDDKCKADAGIATILSAMARENANKINELKRQIELSKKLARIPEELPKRKLGEMECELSALEKENNRSLLAAKKQKSEEQKQIDSLEEAEAKCPILSPNEKERIYVFGERIFSSKPARIINADTLAALNVEPEVVCTLDPKEMEAELEKQLTVIKTLIRSIQRRSRCVHVSDLASKTSRYTIISSGTGHQFKNIGSFRYSNVELDPSKFIFPLAIFTEKEGKQFKEVCDFHFNTPDLYSVNGKSINLVEQFGLKKGEYWFDIEDASLDWSIPFFKPIQELSVHYLGGGIATGKTTIMKHLDVFDNEMSLFFRMRVGDNLMPEKFYPIFIFMGLLIKILVSSRNRQDRTIEFLVNRSYLDHEFFSMRRDEEPIINRNFFLSLFSLVAQRAVSHHFYLPKGCFDGNFSYGWPLADYRILERKYFKCSYDLREFNREMIEYIKSACHGFGSCKDISDLSATVKQNPYKIHLC
jgi:hypothetical protein